MSHIPLLLPIPSLVEITSRTFQRSLGVATFFSETARSESTIAFRSLRGKFPERDFTKTATSSGRVMPCFNSKLRLTRILIKSVVCSSNCSPFPSTNPSIIFKKVSRIMNIVFDSLSFKSLIPSSMTAIVDLDKFLEETILLQK